MKLKYVLVVLVLLGFVGGASAGITYDAPINTINVVGYTEITPCTFNDLYNADVAGGWGVVSKNGNDQFYITARINIGNANDQTWFADEGKHIVIEVTPYPYWWGTIMRIKDYGHFRLGVCKNKINKSTTKGCCLKIISNTVDGILGDYNIDDGKTGTLELYGSQVLYEKTSGTFSMDIAQFYNATIYDCIFGKDVFINRLYNSDIDSLTISDSKYGSVMVTGNLTNIKNLDIWDYGIHYNNIIMEHVVMRGCKFINCSKLCEMQGVYPSPSFFNLYLIDTISNTWKLDYYCSSSSKLYRQYSFNLETSPNAKITIMNHTDIVYQGYAYDNGTIDEQILTMGYYTLLTGNTLNSQNPYRLEISKPGYQTYSNTFNLTEPIIWNIGLEPERIPLDKSGIVTGLGFLIGCIIVSIGLMIMKRREFL